MGTMAKQNKKDDKHERICILSFWFEQEWNSIQKRNLPGSNSLTLVYIGHPNFNVFAKDLLLHRHMEELNRPVGRKKTSSIQS